MITKEQYDQACDDKDRADKIISQYFSERSDSFQKRLKDNPIFTDDELIYSAIILCPCGYGLAYPKDCDPFHYWQCSGFLKGLTKCSEKYPFTSYDIKSEEQPSAEGHSTRGKFIPRVDS